MSAVWKYFRRVENDRDNAICNICKRLLQCKRSCTSGLKKHLENIHKIEIPNFNNHVVIKHERKGSINMDIVKYEEQEDELEDAQEYEDYQVVYDEMEVAIIEQVDSTPEDKPVHTQTPVKVKKTSSNKSFIWNYFKRTSEITARCIECNKTVMCRENHIKGLMKHYNSHILIQSDKLSAEEHIESIEGDDWKALAKLFATDNIPLKTLASSEFFMSVFNTPLEVQNIIAKVYEQCKTETISRISKILESNNDIRFSLIVDNSLGSRYLLVFHYSVYLRSKRL